jgi:hypothetical protein
MNEINQASLVKVFTPTGGFELWKLGMRGVSEITYVRRESVKVSFEDGGFIEYYDMPFEVMILGSNNIEYDKAVKSSYRDENGYDTRS